MFGDCQLLWQIPPKFGHKTQTTPLQKQEVGMDYTQDAAFELAKDALQTDSVLVHYDSTKPLMLACDTSEYGIGTDLSHVMGNGHEKPIAFISHTLNAAERCYSQLECENLAIVYAIKKFHHYL